MPDLIRIIDVWQKIGYIPALLALYELENGATEEEILETISVVVSMRGTTGLAESLRVVQLLDELGKL